MRNWVKLVALAAMLTGAAPSWAGKPDDTQFPGLGSNDYLINYADGCKSVSYSAQPLTAAESDRTKAVRTGDCVAGLLHGPTTLTYPANADGSQTIVKGNYFYGRVVWPLLNTLTAPQANGTVNITAITWHFLQLDYVKSTNLDDFAKADWSLNHRSQFSTYIAGFTKIAVTWAPVCDEAKRKVKFKGCRIGKTVYGIAYRLGSADEIVVPCPDMYTSAGCEETWLRTVAPLATEARSLIARVLADNEAMKARLGPIYTAWIADAPNRQAKADAERRRKEEDQRRQQAAADQRARDEAAARDKAEREFQASLKTLGPGELFAKADEYRRAGDLDKSHQLLRALISRFPNSPLAAVAAQQLSESGPTSSNRPSGNMAKTSAAGGGRSCESYLNEIAGPNNAGQTPNDVSPATSAEYVVWAMQEYRRLAQSLPMCTAEDIAKVDAPLRVEQQRCRERGGRNCESGADYRAPQYRQASQQAFDRTLASGRGGGTTVAAAPAPTSACSGTPDQEFAAFNSDMERLGQVHPIPGSDAGARATYQYSYAYALKGLEILEPRRACMGKYYQPNHDALVGMRDTAKQGCEQLSSSGGACPREFQ